jgi:hypothetical protein
MVLERVALLGEHVVPVLLVHHVYANWLRFSAA